MYLHRILCIHSLNFYTGWLTQVPTNTRLHYSCLFIRLTYYEQETLTNLLMSPFECAVIVELLCARRVNLTYECHVILSCLRYILDKDSTECICIHIMYTYYPHTIFAKEIINLTKLFSCNCAAFHIWISRIEYEFTILIVLILLL